MCLVFDEQNPFLTPPPPKKTRRLRCRIFQCLLIGPAHGAPGGPPLPPLLGGCMDRSPSDCPHNAMCDTYQMTKKCAIGSKGSTQNSHNKLHKRASHAFLGFPATYESRGGIGIFRPLTENKRQVCCGSAVRILLRPWVHAMWMTIKPAVKNTSTKHMPQYTSVVQIDAVHGSQRNRPQKTNFL